MQLLESSLAGGTNFRFEGIDQFVLGVNVDLGVSQVVESVSGEYGMNWGAVAGVSTTATGYPGLMVFIVAVILAAMYFLLIQQLFITNINKSNKDEKPA